MTSSRGQVTWSPLVHRALVLPAGARWRIPDEADRLWIAGIVRSSGESLLDFG